MQFSILTYIATTGVLAAFSLGLLIITALIKKFNLKFWVKYQVPANRFHVILGYTTAILVFIHVSLALSDFQSQNIDYWAGVVALFFFILAFATGIIKKFNIKIFKKYQLPSSKYHYILGGIAVFFIFVHMVLGVLVFHLPLVLEILRMIHV